MNMRSSTIFILLIVLLSSFLCQSAKKNKDEDFSEFDDFDQDEFEIETPSSSVPPSSSGKVSADSNSQPESSTGSTKDKDDEVTIDDDDDDSMFDDEEFETSDPLAPPSSSSPDLKITEIPSNLRETRWDAYHCEAVMIIALLAYLINFLVGRAKNARLADLLFRSQRDLLQRNFHRVGDNGQTRTDESTSEDQQTNNQLLKESENLYVLWCSGRMFVESLLVEIRLIKRQCVFNSLAAWIKTTNDTVVYTIDYGRDEMEPFVFCLAKKRWAAKLHRDMNDLSQFCVERKSADKRGLNANYQILSEFGEVSAALIDQRVIDFVDKFPDALDYIHISDQYTGTKSQTGDSQSSTNPPANTNTGTAAQQQDALNTSERAVRRVLIVAFNLLPQPDRSLQVTLESLGNDYLRLVLHLMDRVGTFHLPSKESKNKAIRNRQRIEEQFLKNVYQQRQEQAQQRREEKRRAEKEKIMQSDDADLQRKWEEKEHKRELKRQKPKMKQMKIKAM